MRFCFQYSVQVQFFSIRFFVSFSFSKNLFHSEEVIWMTTETFFPSGMFKSAAPSNLVGSYRSNTCQRISEVRANLEKK